MASDEEVTLSGELPAGVFTLTPAIRDGDWLSVPVHRFDAVTARDVEFVMDEVMYLISGSEFDNCVFRQDPRGRRRLHVRRARQDRAVLRPRAAARHRHPVQTSSPATT